MYGATIFGKVKHVHNVPLQFLESNQCKVPSQIWKANHLVIQNGHHFDVHIQKWQILLLYNACSAHWCALVSSNTRKNSKKSKSAKLSKIQNGCHFDVLAPKWLNFLLGSVYQYSIVSFNHCLIQEKLKKSKS